MMEDTDFLVLSGFVQRFAPDVEGRAAEPPPPEVGEKMARLASGAASPSERTALAELLKEHPEWLPHLARAIRARG